MVPVDHRRCCSAMEIVPAEVQPGCAACAGRLPAPSAEPACGGTWSGSRCRVPRGKRPAEGQPMRGSGWNKNSKTTRRQFGGWTGGVKFGRHCASAKRRCRLVEGRRIDPSGENMPGKFGYFHVSDHDFRCFRWLSVMVWRAGLSVDRSSRISLLSGDEPAALRTEMPENLGCRRKKWNLCSVLRGLRLKGLLAVAGQWISGAWVRCGE